MHNNNSSMIDGTDDQLHYTNIRLLERKSPHQHIHSNKKTATSRHHDVPPHLLPPNLPKRRLLHLRLLQSHHTPTNLHFRRSFTKMHLSPRLHRNSLRNHRTRMSVTAIHLSQWRALFFGHGRVLGWALCLRLFRGGCHGEICGEYVS